MTTRDEIRAAALRLDPAEREALAEELLQSISNSEQAEIDAAWLAEIERREADLRAGRTTARPVDEVLSELENRTRR